mmetsp:Transcript_34205/g.68100  ORF Transcript_34205/g.68100 Transcript_34205/m.68100 type:complete len:205 (+) Transcript_34205:277-891(+)
MGMDLVAVQAARSHPAGPYPQRPDLSGLARPARLALAPPAPSQAADLARSDLVASPASAVESERAREPRSHRHRTVRRIDPLDQPRQQSCQGTTGNADRRRFGLGSTPRRACRHTRLGLWAGPQPERCLTSVGDALGRWAAWWAGRARSTYSRTCCVPVAFPPLTISLHLLLLWLRHVSHALPPAVSLPLPRVAFGVPPVQIKG